MPICGHATWMRRSDLNSADFSHVCAWGSDSYSAPAASGRTGIKKQQPTTIFSGFSHIKMNEWTRPSILLNEVRGRNPPSTGGRSVTGHTHRSLTHSANVFLLGMREENRETKADMWRTCKRFCWGSGSERYPTRCCVMWLMKLFVGITEATVAEARGGLNVLNLGIFYQTFTVAGELEAAVFIVVALLLWFAVVGRLGGAGVAFQRERWRTNHACFIQLFIYSR